MTKNHETARKILEKEIAGDMEALKTGSYKKSPNHEEGDKELILFRMRELKKELKYLESWY